MKKLIFILMILPIICFSQVGGIRQLKMKSANIVFSDMVGTGNKLIGVDNNGNSKSISVDNSTIKLINDTIRASFNLYSIQTLSGTNVSWDLSKGLDATITLTGNTVITLSNAPIGSSGTLWVTNASTSYTITFSGYVNSIDPFIRLSSNIVSTSGGGKFDDFTFKYNGSKLNWNGTLNRH